MRLFLNRGPDETGDPVLEDVTDAAGLIGLPTKAPHVQIADLDNDGWPEIVTSASAADGTEPAIFRHLGVGESGGVPRFAAPADLGSDQYWVTGGIADFDGDGRQDVFMVEWEPELPSKLWLNESAAGHWVEISGPIGSVVSVYEPDRAGDSEALIGASPLVGSTGYGAGTEPKVHFGVGDLDGVDVVAVLPGGERVTYSGVAANTSHSLGAEAE